jgi:hypothetical protein
MEGEETYGSKHSLVIYCLRISDKLRRRGEKIAEVDYGGLGYTDLAQHYRSLRAQDTASFAKTYGSGTQSLRPRKAYKR